jgi:hypothetical protein
VSVKRTAQLSRRELRLVERQDNFLFRSFLKPWEAYAGSKITNPCGSVGR